MQRLRGLLGRPQAAKTTDNDFVGYEVLIDFIKEHGLQRLEGDLIEIGVFIGGGTAKLARFAGKHHKKVYAVDVFDPGCDQTQDVAGVRMCDIYQAFLGERSQLEVYQQTTRGLDNIVTMRADSKRLKFPGEQKFMFGFIDGNHHPEYVRNDFHIVWHNLVPKGALGFHDYDFDLPQVTQVIDSLIDEHANEISEVHRIKQKHIILLIKKEGLATFTDSGVTLTNEDRS